MNHQNSSDFIRINTSSNANIDVVTNYIIQNQTEEKNDYVKITTATDTDISLSDSGSSIISAFHVKNVHATDPNTIAIYKRISATNYLLFGCVLAAGESIIYTQWRGWTGYTATGKVKVETGSGSSTAWGGITGALSDQTDLQAELGLKATLASPTFTGTVSGITKAMVGLGNVDNTSDSTKNSATVTLTNKRITARVTTITSSATPAINTDDYDAVTITDLAVAITSMTSSLTGTPTNFQKLTIRIKDNGTARAITWGSSFEAKGVALPTTTVISKVLTVGFIYDTVTAKWGCVASAQEV